MIVGIGTDLLDVARMEAELRDGGDGFRDELFTPGESSYCDTKRYPSRHFAARFAAKEALFKALSDAAGASPLRWTDVEVVSDPSGRPRLVLHGAAKDAAQSLGVRTVFLSLSHTRRVAAAHVLLEA